MSGANEDMEMFEEAYSKKTGLPQECLPHHRFGAHEYAGNPHLEGAWLGWNLAEDNMMQLKVDSVEFIKRFFIAYRAFGIYRSPIHKYREDDYQRDCRERMEKLFEEACGLVRYDEDELNRMIDAEGNMPVLVERELPEEESVQLREIKTLRVGDLEMKTHRYMKVGYSLITAQHWFDREEDGVLTYKLSSKAADSEYVDVVFKITKDAEGAKQWLDNIWNHINKELFKPVIKTTFRPIDPDGVERLLIVRFMMPHGTFLSELVVNK